MCIRDSQYTLDHPDDGNRKLTEKELTERRIVQDWVVRPLLRSIPGVAEINSQGGYARQYQVLVNPDRLRHHRLTVRDVYEAVARNNANSGGGVLPQYSEQYLIRGIGLVKTLGDIGSIVLKEVGGTPVYIRDVAEVTFGHEVRQGAVSYTHLDVYKRQDQQHRAGGGPTQLSQGPRPG